MRKNYSSNPSKSSSSSSSGTSSIANSISGGRINSISSSSSSSNDCKQIVDNTTFVTTMSRNPILPEFVLPTPSSVSVTTSSVISSSSTNQYHDDDDNNNYVNDLLKAGLVYESKLGLLLTTNGQDVVVSADISSPACNEDTRRSSICINLATTARSSPTSAVEIVFFDKENTTDHNKNRDWEVNNQQITMTSSVMLPPLVDLRSLVDDELGPLRLSRAAQAWIQIIQCMTSTDDQVQQRLLLPSTISASDRNLHDEVYRRIAHLLVGLVGLVERGGATVFHEGAHEEEVHTSRIDGSNAPPPIAHADVTVDDVDDDDDDSSRSSSNSSYWIKHRSRALAQQLLKQSRMKRQGAMDVYVWFTTFAAECSELLGDIHLAHLAYKSVDAIVKRQQQQQEEEDHHDDTTRIYAVPPTPTTSPGLLHRKTNRGPPTKDNTVDISCPIKDNTVRKGWMAPMTMTTEPNGVVGKSPTPASVGHPRRTRPTTSSSSWSAYSILHRDSKVGNHLVPPGTLEERINRTAGW